jgi:hypothetical protein
MNSAITEGSVKRPTNHEIHNGSYLMGSQALVDIGCTNICETRHNHMWPSWTMATVQGRLDHSPSFWVIANAPWFSLSLAWSGRIQYLIRIEMFCRLPTSNIPGLRGQRV